ncbi:MAG: efflux RND transporter periplasmic adaptor subunit [Thalassotalea sp.]|nr:efflux RND transporter periplasmic adaptor subunit [Thalassotalea sp.]
MKSINTFKPLLLGLAIGSALTAAGYSILQQGKSDTSAIAPAEKQPLYWVAPMDANYRRDKPGKSPMGMDLVPVYEEDSGGTDSGPGTIKISPEVVNNLGVRTAAAQFEIQQQNISTVGYIAFNENKLVQVSPRIKGWVEKLYVKAKGEYVEKGDPLYDLYSPELVNAQEELLLALERGNQRMVAAAENRLIALQVPKQAIVKLKKTRKLQQHLTFYAPQSGVVESLAIREGYYVQPNNGILVIGDLSEVWINVEVFERQTSSVKIGDTVSMTLDYLPGQNWQGQVDYIYPVLNEQTRTLVVRLKFDNSDGKLKPNMFAQVNIIPSNEKQRLLIPKEALIRTGKQDRVVLALGEGRFKSIEVNVGKVFDQKVEILAGLDDGETVVTSAQFLLDSESSKSSDFKRMHKDEDVAMPMSVWTKVTIENLMADHRMATMSHPEIVEWQWPAMTMDFTVADSVDFSLLKLGMTLHVEISKNDDGEYVLSNIHIMEGDDDDAMETMDHSQHKMKDESEVMSAKTTGTINSIMIDHRMLNISRAAIEKWNREADTMDFMVDETVDLTLIKMSMKVSFTFEIRDDGFVITEIQPMTDSSINDHANH